MKSLAALAILCIVVMLPQGRGFAAARPSKLTYSELLDRVQSGEVAGVVIAGGHATSRLKTGETAVTTLPVDYRDALIAMRHNDVNIEIEDDGKLLENAAPFLILSAVWIVLLLIRRFPRDGARLRASIGCS